jgi:hypothetical protein
MILYGSSIQSVLPQLCRTSWTSQIYIYIWCLITGFRRGVNEILVLMGRYAAYIGSFFTDVSGQYIDPIFQSQAVQSSPTIYRPNLPGSSSPKQSKTAWPWKMLLICCPEMFVATKLRCVTSKKNQNLKYVQVNLSPGLMKRSEVKGIEVWRKSFTSSVKWSVVMWGEMEQ